MMFASSSSNDDQNSNKPPHIIKDINPDYVDTLLSNELKSLTFQDRNAIQEELHGVGSLARQESKEMIELSLQRLNDAINDIPNKPAYDISQTYPDTYVNTTNFRLIFLRAELFNEISAAKRMVKFLEMIREYYGDFALRRPIRMDDLGKEELDLCKKGGFQILPCRDRSGRKVYMFIDNHGMGFSVYSRVSYNIIMQYNTCTINRERTEIVLGSFCFVFPSLYSLSP